MKLNRNNKTFLPQKNAIEKKWWLVDANGAILGRLATKVANILRGRTKAFYTPFFDTGDFVIVVNADKVKLTGHKEDQKSYFHHSGYFGGIKEVSYRRMLAAHPDRVVTHAVKGMLPKNRLSRKMLKKLKVYSGPEHKHRAQKPEILEL